LESRILCLSAVCREIVAAGVVYPYDKLVVTLNSNLSLIKKNINVQLAKYFQKFVVT